MTGPYIKVHPPFLRKHALYLAKGKFERDKDTLKCLQGMLGKKKFIKFKNISDFKGSAKLEIILNPKTTPLRNNICLTGSKTQFVFFLSFLSK
jgi:hypothetical protein